MRTKNNFFFSAWYNYSGAIRRTKRILKGGNMIKKILILILALVMTVSFVACGNSNSTDKQEEKGEDKSVLTGGWIKLDSSEVTQKMQEMFKKAISGEESVYEPIAYLEYQVVAGTNYRVLCAIKQEGIDRYAIVTFYEDLDGNVELTETLKSDMEVDNSELLGGWSATKDIALTDEAKEALQKADSKSEYLPIGLLATQVVSGTNYSVLCKDEKAKGEYKILRIYADLDGNAEITESYDFK